MKLYPYIPYNNIQRHNLLTVTCGYTPASISTNTEAVNAMQYIFYIYVLTHLRRLLFSFCVGENIVSVFDVSLTLGHPLFTSPSCCV
jgi:hypothetical protein